MKLVFAGTTIFDDSALLFVKGLSINGSLLTQRDDLLRATNASFQDRGNRFVETRFSVTRTFATLKLAEEFLFTHPLAIIGLGSAVITPSGGGSTLTGANSLLECQGSPRGVETTFNYTLRTPSFVLA